MKRYAVILSKLCLAAAVSSIVYFAVETLVWAGQSARARGGKSISAQAERSLSGGQLGRGPFLEPVVLSPSGSDAAWPAMAVDGRGAIHIAWHGNQEGNYEIYYAKRTVAASGAEDGRSGSDEEKERWMRPLNISRTPGSSARPSIAVGSDGKVHVAWSEAEGSKREIYYVGGEGAAWSRPLRISSSEGQSTNPTVVAGANGVVHLVWEVAAGHSADLYYRVLDRMGWQKTINLTNNSSGMGSWLPSAIMDASSRLHLSWQDFRSGRPEVFRASVSGERLASVVKASPDGGLSVSPYLFLGKDGAVGLVWVEISGGGNEINFARVGAFGTGRRSVAAGPFKEIQSPVALQASDGAILIFFAARTGSGKSLMVVSGDGAKWREPAKLWPLNGPYARLKALVDGRGTVHLLWSHGEPGKNSIYYSRTVR